MRRLAAGTDGSGPRAARARVALAIVAAAVATVACGSRTETPAADGRVEHVLRRGLGAEPATLDPHLAADNASLAVVADLFEGLTTEADDGSIVPGSAESWTLADGGLTYVFRLREGLRWSNGDALGAEQFAAGILNAIAPDTAAPNASLLEPIASVEAVSPTVLRLRLHRPVPYLPALLALPVAAPLHPRAESLEPGPGNGPYRLVRRLPGERVELERNPFHRDAARIAIDRVVHVAIDDLATELKLYRSGELDMTSEVPNAQLDALRQALPGELRLAPYLSVYAYAANLARLPNRDVRLALAMAIDRSRITKQVTGAGERPAYGWVPDGLAGYVPARFEWHNRSHAQAVEEARRLWASARHAGVAPEQLTLCTDASANHRRTAIALADFWRTSFGIETNIVELEWNVYLDAREHPGECDLLRLGWSADFADPEAFAMVFESGHPQNTLGYSSSIYDALLERSRTEIDGEQRLAALALAEAQLLADAPVIPVFFRVSKRLVKPFVHGVTANPLGHVASRSLTLARP